MNDKVGHLIRDIERLVKRLDAGTSAGAAHTRLWVGNLAPGTTDEELSALLQRYGLPPCSSIFRVEGDGSRPGALISFLDLEPETLYRATVRLNGLYWKERSLAVTVVVH
jgi:hypothetical protein